MLSLRALKLGCAVVICGFRITAFASESSGRRDGGGGV
jgi:hypothetical protein